MANLSSTLTSKAQGEELRAWLNRADDSERELIVEADIPRRRVIFQKGSKFALPIGIQGGDPVATAGSLESLRDDLVVLLHTPPVVLKSARALAVQANNAQTREILAHPKVKSVRLNRTLGPVRQAS